MMKQFLSLKAKHPDALLLFRCGDFYETYCDDAVTASRILGITLTPRWLGSHTTRSTPTYPASYALDAVWPSATSWKTLSSQRNW